MRERKKKGKVPAVCTSATVLADGAMVAINQDAPTVWMRLPKDEISDAHQKRAKTRCLKGAKVVSRQCANREDDAAVIKP
jgi:hypothetical protein